MDTNSTTETGERIIFSARRHWAIMIPPFFLLVFAGLSIPTKGFQAWILVFVSLAWIVLSWMNYQSCSLRLTPERLLVKPGFPWPRIHDFPLDSVTSVTVYQPVLGKFLDFGKIRITRTDGKRKFFKMVAGPHLFTSAVYDAKAARAVEPVAPSSDSKEA